MNYELIATNETAKEQAEQVFQSTMFGTVDNFIGMYNSGILNKNFAETKELVDIIRKNYKNVNIVGSRPISIQSQQEFMAQELSQRFKEWSTVSRTRRELLESVQNNLLSEEDILYLTTKGDLLRVEGTEAFETELSKIAKSAQKAILKLSTINPNASLVDNDETEENDYDDEIENAYDLTYDEDESTENSYETEKEEEKETNTTGIEALGRELTDDDTARMIKVSDITEINDNFIIEIYNDYTQYVA